MIPPVGAGTMAALRQENLTRPRPKTYQSNLKVFARETSRRAGQKSQVTTGRPRGYRILNATTGRMLPVWKTGVLTFFRNNKDFLSENGGLNTDILSLSKGFQYFCQVFSTFIDTGRNLKQPALDTEPITPNISFIRFKNFIQGFGNFFSMTLSKPIPNSDSFVFAYDNML